MKTNIAIEKNAVYSIKIDDIGSQGEGIGKIDGFTIFVEGGLPLDQLEVKIVKVNKNFAFGKLLKIENPSPYRIDPPCLHADKCGGCQLQHLHYESQLLFKTKKIKDTLERIGGEKNPSILPAIGMDHPFYYRNKAQFPVCQTTEGIKIGLFQPRSHKVLDIDSCMIQHPVNTEILSIVRRFMNEYKISAYQEKAHEGLVRHLVTKIGFTTGEIMVCLVINATRLPHHNKLIENLKNIKGMTSICLNINREKTNVILGKKSQLLWGKESIADEIDGIRFEISPHSFFQVNPIQTKILYEKALSLAELTGTENVLDLYCGIGTISLIFAKKAKHVLGIEIVPEAVEDAKRNAELNGFTNTVFLAGSAEILIPDLFEKENYKADIVVVDPPRKGCDEIVLKTIATMSIKKILYISCDPATFARDTKFLCQNGYSLGSVQPVDQFCHTTHVETVALFTHVL